MKPFQPTFLRMLLLIACIGLLADELQAGPEWYESYKRGIEAQENGNWQIAAEQFQQAIRLKDRETGKIRAFGATRVEYYPHRELGVSYFHLGEIGLARQELEYSMNKAATPRARDFLDRIEKGQYPSASSGRALTSLDTPPGNAPVKVADGPAPALETGSPAEPGVDASSHLVGERLSIAIMPFESSGIGSELRQIDLIDKLVTAFSNTGRFNIYERAKLNRILQEQQLGMSGVIDIATAAEIGKGIGVDAVVVGSISQGGSSVSIDARLIDTESTGIITSQEAFSSALTLQSVSQMFTEVTDKIGRDIPILHGYVIKVEGSRVTLDIGYSQGLKKGLKCYVYREGAPLVHPVTGEVISQSIEEISEIRISEVYQAYSVGEVTITKSGEPRIRDRVVSK